jgi:hypothetical protein
MCCFFTTLVLAGPRLAFLIWWLIRPVYINLVFKTWIWPLLGLIFLPWTTLMYAIVYGANGIVGFDWIWLALALVADLASYGGGAYGNRDRIPGYGRA